MVTGGQAPKAKYDYFPLSFHLDDVELEQWGTLLNEDKSALSQRLYRLIERETPALRESSRKTASKNERRHAGRRLFLLRLPEYEHVIRFVKINLRRPAFKLHLKRLILMGDKAILPAETTGKSELTQAGTQMTEIPAVQGGRLLSPRELFDEPGKFIQTMIAELKKPEADRLYDWDEIPPADYPKPITSTMLFSRLEEYWGKKNKA